MVDPSSTDDRKVRATASRTRDAAAERPGLHYRRYASMSAPTPRGVGRGAGLAEEAAVIPLVIPLRVTGRDR
jgi:hypothetical protein